MKKIVIEIVGWYGTVALITAYALNSFSIVATKSPLYQLLNLTGSFGILLISLRKKAYQPAVLNIIWAIVAFIGLLSLMH